jgi:DNA-binding Xre family transcriptional regulator
LRLRKDPWLANTKTHNRNAKQNTTAIVFILPFLFPSENSGGFGAAILDPRSESDKQEIPLVGFEWLQHPVMAQKRLAKQLAAFLRKRRGDLTFQQFSRKTGISDSTLHRMELGEQNVTLKTLEQICDRLKCSVAEVFGE